MSGGVELIFRLVELKQASNRLQKLSSELHANKLTFSFSVSRGVTKEACEELIASYNDLGKSLAEVVDGVKRSTDLTRDRIKSADENLGAAWGVFGFFLGDGE